MGAPQHPFLHFPTILTLLSMLSAHLTRAECSKIAD